MQQDAEALLQDPRLLQRIVDDLTACGLVGETVNKLGCYLAATSRLLERPLAVLVQSSSAAGKTTLMDAVLALMPSEACRRASAMSEMALYYDQDGLQHSILAIAEEEGAQSASYSLKLLQSDGTLSFARPVKDPDTGELTTRTHRVEGPVQLMLTTTKTLVDDELANRCLVLTVSEDAEQTGSIHDRQRLAQAWAGLETKAARRALATRHQNAQRLLRPLVVINPYADRLRFTTARVRARRDHQKYLDLIASVTLLHQYQRRRETRTIGGETIEAVLVDVYDIAVANELAHVLLGQSLDELSGPARAFLQRLDAHVDAEAARTQSARRDVALGCRQLSQAFDLAQSSVRRLLAELVQYEWLTVERPKVTAPARYYVHFNSGEPARDRVCLDLLDPANLVAEGETCTYDVSLLTDLASLLTRCSPVAHPLLPRCSRAENGDPPVKTQANGDSGIVIAQTPHKGGTKPDSPSKMQMVAAEGGTAPEGAADAADDLFVLDGLDGPARRNGHARTAHNGHARERDHGPR